MVTLGLGTAQFGLDYGTFNKKGKVSFDDSIRIINKAFDYGFRYVDTAQAYGNAEEIIGKIENPNRYKIVTKIICKNFLPYKNIRFDLAKLVNKSLKKLSIEKLHTLMLHDYKDLKLKNSSRLFEELLNLKKVGLAEKIGVSIYNYKDLLEIENYDFDVVQIPLSIYDQRLIKNGTIDFLKKKGVEIHVRSIFLQGLYNQPVIQFPSNFSSEFVEHHNRSLKFAKELNLSLSELSLFFLSKQKNLDVIIVGCSSLSRLKDFQNKWNKVINSNIDINFEKYSWNLSELELDPRQWN